MVFIASLQYGQCSMSMSYTGLSRRIRLMRTDVVDCSTLSFASIGLLLFFYPSGIISARNLALGPCTPWKRIRLSLDRGINAAKHCMNSSDDRTIWVVHKMSSASQQHLMSAGIVSCTGTGQILLAFAHKLTDTFF